MDNKKVAFSGGFLILLAFLLLLLPLQWLLAAILAAFVHELSHYLAIRACGGRVEGLRIFSFAAQMPLPEMSRGRELICALAGPIGGLCLLPLARWMPHTAICAAMQSVYNLLPIYPLDGGRALQCILSMLLPPPGAGKLLCIITFVCKAAICILAFYAAVCLQLGLMPVLLAILLLLRVK